jgi:MerR family transcriptional regulator/heat shock protein HspR
MAVVCDLLGADAQTIRRLEHFDVASPTRSKGNHRRYSRNDIVTLAAALDLRIDGVPAVAVPRLLELDGHVRALEARLETDVPAP